MMNRPKPLNNSKKTWAGSWSALRVCILSGCLLALPGISRAESGIQSMIYEVYAGGIHAVQAKMDIDMRNPGRYGMVMSARTRGFLGRLAPWHGTFESHGWVMEEGGYRPELHKSTTTWRDEVEIKEYKYNRQGGFDGLIITDHEKPPHKKEVDDELTQGTTDAFTAALSVLSAIAAGEECNSSSEVFDGKRRFEQVFVQEDVGTLEASRYNIFEGIAAQCYVEVKPIAGAWHKKPRGWMSIQEQGRERGTMPTVWIGKLSKDGPAVPVKVRVKTEYGALFMHLAEYSDGEKTVVAEKRVKDDD